MQKANPIEVLLTLVGAEERFTAADLDLQIAREHFVELGHVVIEEYSLAWQRYMECGMMADTARHFKLNVEREALDGGDNAPTA